MSLCRSISAIGVCLSRMPRRKLLAWHVVDSVKIDDVNARGGDELRLDPRSHNPIWRPDWLMPSSSPQPVYQHDREKSSLGPVDDCLGGSKQWRLATTEGRSCDANQSFPRPCTSVRWCLQNREAVRFSPPPIKDPLRLSHGTSDSKLDCRTFTGGSLLAFIRRSTIPPFLNCPSWGYCVELHFTSSFLVQLAFLLVVTLRGPSGGRLRGALRRPKIG